MSIIDTYGDFDVPEEKIHIEVVEDPVKVVLSCYEMFSKLIQNPVKKSIGDFDDIRVTNEIYDCGVKLFNDKEYLKTDLKQTNKILQILNEKYECPYPEGYYDMIGIFLSAFQNSTNLDELLINNLPYQSDLGYKLKKDKTLVLSSGINCRFLGYEHAGTIINFGDCEDGIFGSSEGLNINAGYVNRFGNNRSRGIFINLGIAKETFPNLTGEKISINKGQLISHHHKNHPINLKDNKNLQELELLLDTKLSEIDFLKSKNLLHAAKYFNEFNWRKFRDEITDIAKRIQQKYYYGAR